MGGMGYQEGRGVGSLLCAPRRAIPAIIMLVGGTDRV